MERKDQNVKDDLCTKLICRFCEIFNTYSMGFFIELDTSRF